MWAAVESIAPMIGCTPQTLPHGTQLDQYELAQLNKIAARLNERPRKTLGFYYCWLARQLVDDHGLCSGCT
jgi:hypothetical protein